MSGPGPATAVERATSGPIDIGGPIDVLFVADESARREELAAELERQDRIAVTTGSIADAIERPNASECVVSDHPTPRAGLEHVQRIREVDDSLPIVLYTAEPTESVLEELFVHDWVDYQPRGAGGDAIAPLARRIRRLVDRRRTDDALRRTAAGLRATQDGIAIVDPDGTVAFANGQYARAFGVDRDRIVGTHWRERYPDAEAARLATDAIPAAAEGWRWTGRCAGLDGSGDRVTVQTSIVGMPDGSLVFVVEPSAPESDDA